MPGSSGTIGSLGAGGASGPVPAANATVAGGSSSSSSALPSNVAVNGNSRSTSLTVNSSNFSGKAAKGSAAATEVAKGPEKAPASSKAAWFPGGATENRPGAVSWPASKKKGGAGTEVEEAFVPESRPRSSGAASAQEARRKREQDLCVKIGSYHLLDGAAGRKQVSRIPTRSGTSQEGSGGGGGGGGGGGQEAAQGKSLQPISLEFPAQREDHPHQHLFQRDLQQGLSPVFEYDPMPHFAPPAPGGEGGVAEQPRRQQWPKVPRESQAQKQHARTLGQLRQRLPLAMNQGTRRAAGKFGVCGGDDCEGQGLTRGNFAAAAALRKLRAGNNDGAISQIVASSLRDTSSKMVPKDRGPLQVAVVQPDGELELQSVSSSDVEHAVGGRGSPEERIMLLRKKQRLERISEEQQASKVQHVNYQKKKKTARAGVGCLSKLLLQEQRCGNLTKTPPREAFFQAW